MSSLAAFIFLVAVPIWGVATIVVKWIESWDVPSAVETSSPAEMARRLALLEEIVKSDQSDLASGASR